MKSYSAIVLLALCGVVGCGKQVVPPAESQIVTIRGLDGYKNVLITESGNGAIKVFDVCGGIPPPVWVGGAFEIHFYWDSEREGTNGPGCYVIQSATRIQS